MEHPRRLLRVASGCLRRDREPDAVEQPRHGGRMGLPRPYVFPRPGAVSDALPRRVSRLVRGDRARAAAHLRRPARRDIRVASGRGWPPGTRRSADDPVIRQHVSLLPPAAVVHPARVRSRGVPRAVGRAVAAAAGPPTCGGGRSCVRGVVQVRAAAVPRLFRLCAAG